MILDIILFAVCCIVGVYLHAKIRDNYKDFFLNPEYKPLK